MHGYFHCRLRAVIVALVAAFGLLTLATPASAQAGLAGKPLALCIKRATAGDQAIRQFRARFDCTTRQTSFGPGDFWARSMQLPARADPLAPAAIRFAATWQKSVTVYGRYVDGVVVPVTFNNENLSQHMQLGAMVEGVLPGRNTPLKDLLWHIEGSRNIRGILVGARIATIAESMRANLMMAAIYAAFGGLCMALLIHNVAMWGAMRHNFQIAYCLMTVSLMIYATSFSGALSWIFPAMPDVHRLRINYLFLATSAACALLFARTYFEPRVFSRPLAIASIVVCAMLIGSALAFALFAPWYSYMVHRLFAWSFLGLAAIVPVILWRAWRQGSNFLWIFAISWAAPIVFAGFRVANVLNIIGWNFWVDNSTILAMTAEALMSSLAIAYRIRLLSRERDDARVQELAARALADLDPLTGLLNRRSFLSQAIGRPGEQVLMIADLDHFKDVNETIGHDGGDEVLRVFARALCASMPRDALVARMGGEEFAIVMHADSAIDPNLFLDRLRAERMPFDLTVTASIGSSRGSIVREADWKQLYRRADRALFAAKADGRDRARNDFALAA